MSIRSVNRLFFKDAVLKAALLLLLSLSFTKTQAQSSPDTLKTDAPESKELEQEITYSAKDSIRFDLENEVIYLFGDAQVNYGSYSLSAAYMEISMKNNTVLAKAMTDSLGKISGKPHFEDGTATMDASEILFNLDSKKGLVKDVITQEGEGYIHMGISKKQADDEVHLANGKYTTCSLEHPHYYFKLKKAIVIPDDKIVSGPVNLVVADIPTPIGLPFGFFPNAKRQSRGILIPTFGESPTLGFYLLNGGYYTPLGEKADLQLLGDIYSRGSWGGKSILRYNNRYRNRGTLDLSYTIIKFSDKEYPDYSENRNFFVRWNHQQDAKAHPYRRFSANVNAGSRNNFQNNFNTSSQDYLTNTFQSNISYSYSVPNSPLSFQANARHSQNSLTGQMNVTLPEVTANVNRFFPFRSMGSPARKRWYKDIGFTYSNNFKNDLTVNDTLFRQEYFDLLPDRMRYGMRHFASASTTFKIWKQRFSFNPSVTATDRWYLQTISKTFDNTISEVITDTVFGFRRAGDLAMNASLNSKIYGFYSFLGKRKTVIRHTLTPTVNFTYRPDFSTQIFGYYGTGGTYASYSPYDIGIFGKPPIGESGMVTFGLINGVDMKYRTFSDTASADKKISLIENFSVQGSYDFFKDSLNVSAITLSGRTRLGKNFGIVYAGLLDPYVYENGQVRDQLLWKSGSLGVLRSQNLALSWSARSKSTKAGKRNETKTDDEENELPQLYPDGYIDFTVPWNINVFYNLRLDKGFISGRDTTYLTQSLMLNGELLLSENWKIGVNTGYDFLAKEMTFTEINLYRDLHCWELHFNWIPFGFRKSYMITLNVKASVLQDLRLNRRRSWFDRL